MRIKGKITLYNGYTGYIKGIDGKDYLFSKKDVVTDDLNENNIVDLQEKEIVEFTPEEFKTVEVNENVARFVKKLVKR